MGRLFYKEGVGRIQAFVVRGMQMRQFFRILIFLVVGVVCCSNLWGMERRSVVPADAFKSESFREKLYGGIVERFYCILVESGN